jgi:hypothetical protein
MNRSGLFSPVLISLPALIVLVLLALTTTPTAVHGFGLSCTANSTGAWDVAATWINCNDTYPGEGDQVNIAGSEVQVTIRAGLSVNVQSISINSYGGLINKGKRYLCLAARRVRCLIFFLFLFLFLFLLL